MDMQHAVQACASIDSTQGWASKLCTCFDSRQGDGDLLCDRDASDGGSWRSYPAHTHLWYASLLPAGSEQAPSAWSFLCQDQEATIRKRHPQGQDRVCPEESVCSSFA